MKNVLKFLSLVLLSVTLTSCEGIKGWFDREVDTTLDGELIFVTDPTETKSTDAYTFNDSITIQVMNDDLYEHEDKIQGFMTSDCTFEVLSVDDDGVVLLEGSEFTIYNANNPGLRVFVPPGPGFPVEVGSSLTLTEEALEVLDDILDDRIPFTVKASGSANKGGVTIELRCGIETIAIVNPFD
jgi:hypothetical protein